MVWNQLRNTHGPIVRAFQEGLTEGRCSTRKMQLMRHESQRKGSTPLPSPFARCACLLWFHYHYSHHPPLASGPSFVGLSVAAVWESSRPSAPLELRRHPALWTGYLLGSQLPLHAAGPVELPSPSHVSYSKASHVMTHTHSVDGFSRDPGSCIWAPISGASQPLRPYYFSSINRYADAEYFLTFAVSTSMQSRIVTLSHAT